MVGHKSANWQDVNRQTFRTQNGKLAQTCRIARYVSEQSGLVAECGWRGYNEDTSPMNDHLARKRGTIAPALVTS